MLVEFPPAAPAPPPPPAAPVGGELIVPPSLPSAGVYPPALPLLVTHDIPTVPPVPPDPEPPLYLAIFASATGPPAGLGPYDV